MCNTTEPDYTKLKSLLEDMSLSGRFPYQHIIVDEGQDFGAENIEETEILDMFRTIIDMEDKKNTSFYVFYDELQLIQASAYLPCKILFGHRILYSFLGYKLTEQSVSGHLLHKYD